MNAINDIGNAMYEMQEEELKEMLEKAKESVEIDQAIVDKLNDEIDRYSEMAGKSMALQHNKLNETNMAGESIGVEEEKLKEKLHDYEQKQKIKAALGFIKGMFSLAKAGAFFWNPALAAGAAAEAASKATDAANEMAEAGEDIKKILEIFKEIERILQILEDLVSVWDATGQWG